ncbi:MAG: hypothetical protein US49_C0007G0011 [candidate division TM6 bacterium GW2011_GWF2_37_49]|nr:MAG: hypothetical protein US49_C0007G0011 [candidate division TM6 bacterium GW2011_GWF2_37_49]
MPSLPYKSSSLKLTLSLVSVKQIAVRPELVEGFERSYGSTGSPRAGYTKLLRRVKTKFEKTEFEREGIYDVGTTPPCRRVSERSERAIESWVPRACPGAGMQG